MHGDLSICCNSIFDYIAVINRPTFVGGSLIISSNERLQCIYVFYYIKSLGADLVIDFNEMLAIVYTFQTLGKIKGSILIENNPKRTNAFLNSLETVGGDLVIHLTGFGVIYMNVSNLLELGGSTSVAGRKFTKSVILFLNCRGSPPKQKMQKNAV